MKIINSISIAVSMVFLFSAPQESIALKHSPNIITNKKQNNISQEKLANIIIAQAKRPNPPGKMSGQRREPSSNRGPQLGNKKPGKPFQSRDSSLKKGPLVFQTRTSSNGKLNHPLQQTDE